MKQSTNDASCVKVWMRRGLLGCGAAAAIVAFGGCEEQPEPAPAPQTPPRATAPDNTGVNARDREGHAPTPMDQGQGQSDVTIAADIRKAIMDDSAMSMNGQNCKVIVTDGVVTLRGPVDSQAEKDAIEGKARAIAGVKSVVNELEVKQP